MQGSRLTIFRGGLLAGSDVVLVTVALYRTQGNLGQQLIVNQRHTNTGSQIAAIVVSHPAIDKSAECIRGWIGGNQKRAGGGVFAEQGALGTAQYLHALYVYQIQQLAIPARQVQAIQVNPDGAVYAGAVISLAYAAYPYLRATALVNLQTGRLVADILEVGNARVTQLVAGKRGNGHRYILYGLFPFASGNNHFFQHTRLCMRGLWQVGACHNNG